MMRRLTRSFLGTTWALTLLAARESGLLARSPFDRRLADDAEHGLDAVTWRVRSQLGPTLSAVFQAGDSLQRDAVDLTWSSLADDPFRPAGWIAGGADLADAAGSTAMRFFVPGREARLAWRELGNKVEVYRLVRQAHEKIGVPPPGEPFDLPELLRRSYALGEYPSLWAVEGLGHDWLEHEWRGPEPPRGLLNGPAGRGLPPESLTMLHAGIGLGYAQRLLADLPPGVPEATVRPVVERFTALCRESSMPGYEGAALESLGLVTRSFHPSLVTPVDRVLRVTDALAREYFWHGVGRALYFLPINFLPCGRVTWRPFEMGDREALDPVAHRNVRAGLGWAFALVNMRQPAIVSRLMLATRGGELAEGGGFANGVASTVMIRRDTSPGGDLLPSFLHYRPEGAGVPWWRTLVRIPAEDALERIYPGLARRGMLGQIFRYRTFDELERAAEGGS